MRAQLGGMIGKGDRCAATEAGSEGVLVTQEQLVEACGETSKYLKPYQVGEGQGGGQVGRQGRGSGGSTTSDSAVHGSLTLHPQGCGRQLSHAAVPQ